MATVYLTPAQLLQRWDQRTIGDLASDANVRLTPNQILTDPIVAAAIEDATAIVNASLFVGNRYTPAQIALLSGADLAVLTRLTGWLTLSFLCQRRASECEYCVKAEELADKLLEELKNGDIVLNVQALGNADIEFPSMVGYATVNLLRTRATPLFPSRRVQNTSTDVN